MHCVRCATFLSAAEFRPPSSPINSKDSYAFLCAANGFFPLLRRRQTHPGRSRPASRRERPSDTWPASPLRSENPERPVSPTAARKLMLFFFYSPRTNRIMQSVQNEGHYQHQATLWQQLTAAAVGCWEAGSLDSIARSPDLSSTRFCSQRCGWVGAGGGDSYRAKQLCFTNCSNEFSRDSSDPIGAPTDGSLPVVALGARRPKETAKSNGAHMYACGLYSVVCLCCYLLFLMLLLH